MNKITGQTISATSKGQGRALVTNEQLTTLRNNSRACWDMCVDTAEAHGQDPERRRAAKRDRRLAMVAWDYAIELVRASIDAGHGPRYGEAVEELQSAATLGASWGDDQHERAAIALLNREADLAAAELMGGSDDPDAQECAAACREAW